MKTRLPLNLLKISVDMGMLNDVFDASSHFREINPMSLLPPLQFFNFFNINNIDGGTQ